MSTPKPWLLVVLACAFCFPHVLHASCDQFSAKNLNRKASPYQQEIQHAAQKYKVSQALIKAVITAESCFNETAVSPKEAAGLMQLMPDTAVRFGVINVFDPAENINAGTRYLHALLKRYKGSLTHVIAAYNAGEGRIDHGEPVTISFKETRGYIRRVLTALGKLEEDESARQEAVELLAEWEDAEARYQAALRGETLEPEWAADQFARGGKVILASWQETPDASVKPGLIPVAAPLPANDPYPEVETLDSCQQIPASILRLAYQEVKGHKVNFYYKAGGGETLFRAADKLGVHIGEILLYNDLSADDQPAPGQLLKVAECTKTAG
ncbi:MAG: lytic transglycosylase [Gammaproteobacteria bacterium]|nr:lytic transglycosylase [Gammaproteobacteria bacterium]MBU1724709.1 lytic transglycosylase [Gammaproteobacteria bacterium]MBU2005477.1 lytic transglycosylase [Gammaproteobacteria bacterium]